MLPKQLPDHWQVTTLGAIAKKDGYGLVDGPFGSNLPASDYTPSGVPVIRGSNLTLGMGKFVADDFVFVSDQTAKRLERSLCEPDDIVFTKKGTLGQVGLIPNSLPYKRFLVSSNQMKLSVDREVADHLFVYYFVSSPISREKIIRDSEATGVPKTNLVYLRTFPITLPPLPEQRAIAHILGTLDDKIELNRRMNETLEAMAQVIFKSWFVDFDPVRAKAEGRDTGLPPHIKDLFPARLVGSKLGEIPEEWEVSSLSDLCEYIMSGGTPNTRKDQYWGGNIPWLSSGETRNQFIITTEKTITPLGVSESSTRKARAGSTVIASAGQGSTRGQTSLLMFDSYINQSVVAIAADHKTSSDLYVFFNLAKRYEEFRQISDSHSSRGSLTTKLLGQLRVLKPPVNLAIAFDERAKPIIGKIENNLLQSRSLAALRDTLLPKLMNGEVRVKDAEAAIC